LSAGLGGVALAGQSAASADTWPAVTAFPSGVWSPGRWVWADLFTDDLATAERFYASVMGWTFAATSVLAGRYRLARAGDEHVGALVLRETRSGTGRGNRWVPLMSVERPVEAVQQAQAAGGRVLYPPRQLSGRGEVAFLADPEGTPFGVIRAEGGDPEDYLAETGEWVWMELWSLDPLRMIDFYAALGPYELAPEGEEDVVPVQLSSGGLARASVRSSLFPKLPPVWIPFLRVDDASATAVRVRAAGGRVVIEPRPDRLQGRVAVFTDVGGAPFGVLAVSKEPA